MADTKKADTKKKVPYLTVNYKTMSFTINDAVAPTKQDNEDIERYLRAGYKMRHKSVKRTEQAKGKALTNEAIREALKDNKEALAQYEAIKADKSKTADGKRAGGFFKAKAWYVDWLKKQDK